MTNTMISQSTDLSSCDTMYNEGKVVPALR
jgi:hypothetical protein